MAAYDRTECPTCHKFVASNWMHRHMLEHRERGEKSRPLPGHIGDVWEFTQLPCGRRVNLDGRRGECCRSVCPEKGDREIDRCYDLHKWIAQKAGASRLGR